MTTFTVTKCVFCNYKGPSKILYHDDRSFVIEPIKPVTPGHVLIIPYQHISDFADNPALAALVMRTAGIYTREKRLGDCNIITSRGITATQTVMHMHIHLIPRTKDDGLYLPWTNQQ